MKPSCSFLYFYFTVYFLLILRMPLTKAEADNNKMNAQIAPLVIAVKGSISDRFPFALTIISIFCNVMIETSASIKLIDRSNLIRSSADCNLFSLLKEPFHSAEDELVGDLDHFVHRDLLSVLHPLTVGVQHGVVDKAHQDFFLIIIELMIFLRLAPRRVCYFICHLVTDRVIAPSAGDFFVGESLLGRIEEKRAAHLVEVVGQGIVLHTLQKTSGQLRLHFGKQKIERFIVMIKGLFIHLAVSGGAAAEKQTEAAFRSAREVFYALGSKAAPSVVAEACVHRRHHQSVFYLYVADHNRLA